MTRVTADAFSAMRVLVVHEWLYTWAGSERALEEILRIFPHADLVAGMVTPEMRREKDVAARARESWVGRLPGARTRHRWFLPLHGVAFATLDTSRYDLIVSSSHAVSKYVPRRRGAMHVCYCYSPPRYVWDLQDVYERHSSATQRLALRAIAAPMRVMDRWGARRVDHFVAISRAVAGRIARNYGRTSDVVYPPVRPKPQSPPEPASRPFLLYLGRLVPYKRVDLVIQAASRLGLALRIAGDGPERERLEHLAGGDTEFLGEVSEDRAGSLLSACAAFVFPAEEDFGIAPVEANAHGRPVVYFNRGGAAETMIPGQTGVACDEQSVDAFSAGIEACLATRWDAATLRENAQRFSPERFRAGLTQAILGKLEGTENSHDHVAAFGAPVSG